MLKRPRAFTAAFAASFTLLLILSLCDLARAACQPDTVGLPPPPDPVEAARAPFLGEAVGQTFYATDTLVTKLTVWRPANNLSAIGAHLFITAVDTTWNPPRPTTGAILLDGPTILVYSSNPPGATIEMPFVIDPPLALPHPGYYAWFLQAENCSPGEPWIIAADDTNPYPQGIYWLTSRSLTSCVLPGVAGGEDNTDLLFRIEFCREITTAALQQTWGALKVIYR
jgi:hypothetical protein